MFALDPFDRLVSSDSAICLCKGFISPRRTIDLHLFQQCVASVDWIQAIVQFCGMEHFHLYVPGSESQFIVRLFQYLQIHYIHVEVRCSPRWSTPSRPWVPGILRAQGLNELVFIRADSRLPDTSSLSSRPGSPWTDLSFERTELENWCLHPMTRRWKVSQFVSHWPAIANSLFAKVAQHPSLGTVCSLCFVGRPHLAIDRA